MFMALVLVCGLDNNIPKTTEGCGFVVNSTPMLSKEACFKFHQEGLPLLLEGLPEGSYVEDVKCVALNRSL